jgi:hypothetical protein
VLLLCCVVRRVSVRTSEEDKQRGSPEHFRRRRFRPMNKVGQFPGTNSTGCPTMYDGLTRRRRNEIPPWQ